MPACPGTVETMARSVMDLHASSPSTTSVNAAGDKVFSSTQGMMRTAAAGRSAAEPAGSPMGGAPVRAHAAGAMRTNAGRASRMYADSERRRPRRPVTAVAGRRRRTVDRTAAPLQRARPIVVNSRSSLSGRLSYGYTTRPGAKAQFAPRVRRNVLRCPRRCRHKAKAGTSDAGCARRSISRFNKPR